MGTNEATTSTDFIRTIIAEDLEANKNEGRVMTRFPLQSLIRIIMCQIIQTPRM